MGRSRWDRLARTARGAVALAMVVVPAASTAAGSGAAEWTPSAWAPVDEGVTWGDGVVTHLAADALGACAEGTLSVWTSPEGHRVGLVWIRCPDTLTAAANIPDTLLGYGYFPDAGVAPVFDADTDVAAYSGEEAELSRFWSEGEDYVAVARNCVPAADCVGATARYMAELSALNPATLNPLPSVTPADDRLAAFRPSGADQDWARIRYQSVRSTVDHLDGECADGSWVEWIARDLTVVRAFEWRCATAVVAFRAYTKKWSESDLVRRPDLDGVLGPGADQAGTYLEGRGIARSWIQGVSYVNVQRECPEALTQGCIDASATDAEAVANLLEGPVRTDNRVGDQIATAGIIFILIPVGTLLALLVLRAAVGGIGQRGYGVAPEGAAQFTAVDKPVRRARLGRWARRAVLIVATSATWFGLLLMVSSWSNVVLFGIVFFAGPPALYAVFTILLRLVWRPGAIARAGGLGRGRLGLMGTAGVGLTIAARAIGVLAIVGYLFMCALVIYTDDQLMSENDEQIATMRASGPLGYAWAVAQQLAVDVSATGQEWVLFPLFVVLPATIAYFLDRLGRRLRARSLPAMLAADTRPYFLYLRGFDEDRLRTTSSLTRRGFIESFTPFARPRFEEVLVEYLSRFGPVIAISPRDQRLPDLGAAKVSLEGDAWQDHVREWVGGAQAVVMAATPGEVRRGLAWEIEYIAHHDLTPRVMLVVAPWRRTELTRRWRGFVDHASKWPLFAPLKSDPMPSGVQLLTWTTERGWSGYGARRRWDWTYAASILRALEDAQPSWTRDREADHIDASALIEQAEGAQHPAHSAMAAVGGLAASGPDDPAAAREGN
ncbi:MAG: hypothetical protein ABWZ16_07800 [Microbacterium sp.]